MSAGKYLSLKEAKENDKLDQFIKEHPSKGDGELLDEVIEAMSKPKKEKDEQTP
jgi:hypothetical protein